MLDLKFFDPPAQPRNGYTFLILLFAVFLLTIGLMVAMPVWETQIRRELEEELIFRGNQYVEAVRVFQSQNPGRYPESLEQLLEEKCLRRLFPDPMTEDGTWNVILLPEDAPAAGQGRSRRQGGQQSRRGPRRPQRPGQAPPNATAAAAPQKVLIAPLEALDSIPNARLIGVVSRSTRASIRIYHEQTSYDQWLFFLGFDPKALPEIVQYGSDEESERKDGR